MTDIFSLLVGSGLTLCTTLAAQLVTARREGAHRRMDLERQALTRFHESKVPIYTRFLASVRALEHNHIPSKNTTFEQDAENCLIEIDLVSDTVVTEAAKDLLDAARRRDSGTEPIEPQVLQARESSFLLCAREELKGPKVWPTRKPGRIRPPW